MDYEQIIHECAGLYGIQPDYYDIWGQHHQVSVASKLALLKAMHVPTDPAAMAQTVHEHKQRDGSRLLPPVLVVRVDRQPVQVPLTLPEAAATALPATLQWRLDEEQGQPQHGQIDIQQLPLSAGSEGYQQAQWVLPHNLPCGYHRLFIEDQCCLLIITPSRCYQAVPPAAKDNPSVEPEQSRCWGLSVQLYALRSRRSWGMGDFSDLQAALRTAAALGAAALGVNPLHALFPHDAGRYSPYSPSSRRFLNPLYLDIEAVPDYAACAEARAMVQAEDFQSSLRTLREAELIDYHAVSALKFQVLRCLFTHFCRQPPSTPRRQVFETFRQTAGIPLTRHALAEALQAWFYQLDPACHGWRSWLPSYRDPDSDCCTRFAAEHADEILFFAYLQWLAHEQLQAARQLAQELGLAIGLYCDLAVGVDSAGAEVWAEPQVYAADAHIGAPPDDFSPTGQDWGLAPYQPVALRASGYQAFIATLRASMRYAGALRIDHVMGLSRLFWVPPDSTPAAGAYVNYPFADLLGILALESQRNQCLVVGEDLGTVEDHVRQALDEAGVLSYRVLYFEKHWQGDHSFKLPEHYPEQALVTASTHDLPTLSGFWQGRDLQLRAELGLYPSEQLEQSLRETRAQDKVRLKAALTQAGLWTEPETEPTATPARLALAVQQFLARSPARLLMVQIDDVLECVDQVNLPGTVDAYPNWRRKLPLLLEDWPSDVRLQQLAEMLRTERPA